MRLLAMVLVMLPAACSRRALSPDAGGTGQIGIDGGDGGAIVDLGGGDVGGLDSITGGGDDADGGGGSIPCGTLTCTGTDLCVSIAGCGGPLNCVDQIDAGVCPPGSTRNTTCSQVTGLPCMPDCPPPTYFCAPRPAACAGAISCACIDRSVCMFGMCVGAQDRMVGCGFQ